MKALDISLDGRSASNWSAFKMASSTAVLAAREHKGIYLNSLLF